MILFQYHTDIAMIFIYIWPRPQDDLVFRVGFYRI